MKTLHKKMSLLFALYFCQGLPGGFLSDALPVILRKQGLSLTMIGFTAFLSLPWILKIFWAPLVDKFHLPAFGKRKSWIIPAHIGIITICILLSTLSPQTDLLTIALLFLALNFFAATQDIGVDGFAVDVLEKEEMGPGNSAQISGFKLGNLIGGGVLLSLSAYLGWSGNFLIMAGMIATVMLFLLFSNEKELNSKREAYTEEKKTGQVMKKIFQALKTQGLYFWLFLIYIRFSEVLGVSLMKPLLTDQKFSLPEIGILDGIIGSGSVILGGILGGYVCRKKGWHMALAIFGPLQGITLAMMGIFSVVGYSFISAGILVGFEKFFGGCVGVSVFTLSMSRCHKDVGASQFTASQVIFMAGGYIAYPLSGFLADHLKYLPVMATSGVLACMIAFFAFKVKKKEVEQTAAVS